MTDFRPGPERLVVDEGLTLVTTTADDGPRAYGYVKAQEGHYGKHLDYVGSYTEKRAVVAYQEIREHIDTGSMLNYWMVASGETVGDVGMSLHDGGVAELGYQVFEHAQGRGYATRGSRALLGLAAERHIQLVELHIKPANGPSLRVAQRLGATLMGAQFEERSGVRALHQVWGVRLDG